ncbi:MAG: hypothetical protein R3E97_05470 [Candidatus Eisenbacteria bacterium]
MSRTRRLAVPVALSYLTFASAIATPSPAAAGNQAHIADAVSVQSAIDAQAASPRSSAGGKGGPAGRNRHGARP